MHRKHICISFVAAIGLLCASPLLAQEPMSTAFTYQGQLKQAGAPVNGLTDFEFTLWDAESGGSQVGWAVQVREVDVVDGLFTVELDFGSSAFNGEARWLEIGVTYPSGGGDPTTLSPRQPLTGAPYALYALSSPGGAGFWEANADDIYNTNSGNVGIGTTSPDYPLHVVSADAETVFGENTASGGVGVYGKASSFEGGGFGVRGDTYSTTGVGVFGIAAMTTGINYGVYGQSQSQTGGRGVYGLGATGTGVNYGVYGQSNSADGWAGYFVGRGYFSGNVGIGTTTPDHTLHVISAAERTVSGENTAAAGATYGGYFQTASINGRGVFAKATAASGTTYGGYFESASTDGRGVYGRATALSGTSYGGYFQAASTNGTAVVGWASNSSGSARGVVGQTNSSGGRGVHGEATSSSGTTYGVFGLSQSTDGRGVLGGTTASTGVTYGVYGESQSTSGRGVYGYAIAWSGTNYGVHGITNSSSGYGVYATGDYGGTGAKHFIQPHPSDPSKQIHFVCLEGNESGTYSRGSAQLVDGLAVIEVPEEFRLVSEPDGLTVQVTAMGPHAGLWVESKSLDRIVVRGNGDVEFDYFVNGIRRGYADLELIRENHAYVPEVRGVPYGTQYREGHRRILVENGILNPDFTANEETAARMGWPLKDPEPDYLLGIEAEPNTEGAPQ